MNGCSCRCLGLVAVAMAFLAAPARAEDTNELQSLLNESVITTASSTAESASSAPATSTTITAEELRIYGIRTVAEAVDYLSLGARVGVVRVHELVRRAVKVRPA